MAKSTTNYELFKKNPKNRELDSANLAAITKSISMKNLLSYRPILVDKDMMVIDGQHRLEVAKSLGLEIYYEINAKASGEDIYILNAHQKSWINKDFLHYYATDGLPNYIKFKNFMIKYNLPFAHAFIVLNSGKRNREGYEMFNKGEYKFPNDDDLIKAIETLKNINHFVEFLCEKTPEYKAISTSGLVRSLIYFFNIYKVDFDLFMNKFEYQMHKFRKCSRMGDYLTLFIDIYNWKNQHPLQRDARDVI